MRLRVYNMSINVNGIIMYMCGNKHDDLAQRGTAYKKHKYIIIIVLRYRMIRVQDRLQNVILKHATV